MNKYVLFLKRFSLCYLATKSALQRANRGAFSLFTTVEEIVPSSEFTTVIKLGSVKPQPMAQPRQTKALVSGPPRFLCKKNGA